MSARILEESLQRGTGCKSSGLARRRFPGNLSHKADGRLLAQLRSTWQKYCTLLNQELGEAEGTAKLQPPATMCGHGHSLGGCFPLELHPLLAS